MSCGLSHTVLYAIHLGGKVISMADKAKYQRASEVRNAMFDNSQPLDGFIDQEVVIHSFEDRASQFNNGVYIVIAAEDMDGNKLALRTSGSLVRRRLVEMRERLPLVFKVIQRGRAFDLE